MKSYEASAIFILFIIIFLGKISLGQIKADSAKTDRGSLIRFDSIVSKNNHQLTLDSFLKTNKYINASATPVSLAVKQKTENGKEFIFYLIAIIVLLLGLVKVYYTKYLNNIFRVFFNTSLRQNQLKDLLLQSKLPSLIFNIFFVVSAGLYGWLILDHYHLLNKNNNYLFIAFSILSVGTMYVGKYLTLKIIGWISGMSSVAEQYIFVIFLVNKIIGVLLIPFIILLSFAPVNCISVIVVSSFCMIGFFFIIRYLRTYGLLQYQFKINGLYFLLYIVGLELLPILIIYKLMIKTLLRY